VFWQKYKPEGVDSWKDALLHKKYNNKNIRYKKDMSMVKNLIKDSSFFQNNTMSAKIHYLDKHPFFSFKSENLDKISLYYLEKLKK